MVYHRWARRARAEHAGSQAPPWRRIKDPKVDPEHGRRIPVALRASTIFPAATSLSFPSWPARARSHTVPWTSRPYALPTATASRSSVMAIPWVSSAAEKTLASPRLRSEEPMRWTHLAKHLISSSESSLASPNQSASRTVYSIGCRCTPALISSRTTWVVRHVVPASRSRKTSKRSARAKWFRHVASNINAGFGSAPLTGRTPRRHAPAGRLPRSDPAGARPHATPL